MRAELIVVGVVGLVAAAVFAGAVLADPPRHADYGPGAFYGAILCVGGIFIPASYARYQHPQDWPAGGIAEHVGRTVRRGSAGAVCIWFVLLVFGLVIADDRELIAFMAFAIGGWSLGTLLGQWRLGRLEQRLGVRLYRELGALRRRRGMRNIYGRRTPDFVPDGESVGDPVGAS